MFNIQSTGDANLNAFICGFMLPFIASAFGFAVYVVRKIISNADHNN